MKKQILVVLFFLFLVGNVLANVDFYGNVRMGAWYEFMDKHITGVDKARLDFKYQLYNTSRMGAKFSKDDINAKVEVGFNDNAVTLRHLYAEYNINSISLLIGQTYTGFSEWASQATSILLNGDNLLKGYGVMYDGRQPMIRLRMDNGAYISFMKPVKIDANGDINGIDALIPKINFGYKFKESNLSLHPTFGINISQYNKDFALGEFDKMCLAYVFATTGKYTFENMCFKLQVNFGQNINDYGIQTANDMSHATVITGEVKNAVSFGSFFQFGYKLYDNFAFKIGCSYLNTDRKDFGDDPIEVMSGFLQANFELIKNVMIVPEVGMFDSDLSNSGSILYWGTKLQMNF